MRVPGPVEVVDGVACYRPRGSYSIVEAVALVSSAIAYCRDRGVTRLLIDGTGIIGAAIPTLVDRFLMVEEWAHQSDGIVVVALVASPEYIHPEKFGVKVALDFGLVCDVYTLEDAAWKWLREVEPRKVIHER
jgi:hypothetical protein